MWEGSFFGSHSVFGWWRLLFVGLGHRSQVAGSQSGLSWGHVVLGSRVSGSHGLGVTGSLGLGVTGSWGHWVLGSRFTGSWDHRVLGSQGLGSWHVRVTVS